MGADDRWTTCRIAFLETAQALGLSLESHEAMDCFRRDWHAVRVIEVDRKPHRAGDRAGRQPRPTQPRRVASGGSPRGGPRRSMLATWDRRLWGAGEALGLRLLPEEL